MSELALVIDGTRHRGWTEVEVRRGLEQMADGFEIALTDRWSAGQLPVTVDAGAPCTLEIAEDLTDEGEPLTDEAAWTRVLTGYIDDVLPDYDAEAHRLVISGRSKTADLVDSSGRAEAWESLTLLQVAQRVAAPFDIEVVAEVDVGAPLRAPSVEAGQPYGEALQQLAAHRAVLLVADAEGRLVITRPPRARLETELALGQNILRGRGRFSYRDRFSEIEIQGQAVTDDFFNGGAAAQPYGKAHDGRVGRHRKILLLSDTSVDSVSCRTRAEWEKRKRTGRARGVTYTVSGWMHRGGQGSGLWRPGDLVRIRDAWLGLDNAEWVIAEARLLLDAGGERSELRVVPREAYDLAATPEAPADGEETGAGWPGGIGL